MAVGKPSSFAGGGSSHGVTTAGAATAAAAVGQVAAVRILHAFPVGSYCCMVDHCLRDVLQQPPKQISIRPAKEQYLKEFWYIVWKSKGFFDENMYIIYQWSLHFRTERYVIRTSNVYQVYQHIPGTCTGIPDVSIYQVDTAAVRRVLVP